MPAPILVNVRRLLPAAISTSRRTAATITVIDPVLFCHVQRWGGAAETRRAAVAACCRRLTCINAGAGSGV